MAILSPTTELEAVNTMLATVGQSPISTLTNPGLVDAVLATSLLTEVSRDVQKRGWWFNTELDYTIAPDVSGYLNLPSNALKASPGLAYKDKKLTIRGTKVWDLVEHTYVFTESVDFNLVLGLSFDELPEAARRYITIRAARIFQDRVLTSDNVHSYTQDDEDRALADLQSAEHDAGDYSLLDHPDAGLVVYDRWNY